MADTILLVFEGETVEGQIFENIKKIFFSKSDSDTIIKSCFCGDIFQLWDRVKDDTGLDIVEMLKERLKEMCDSDNSKSKRKKEMYYTEIEDLHRKNVSGVHLFFDYDAHCRKDIASRQENHQKALGLLSTFNDEFEMGRLWISYPMAEALKNCRKNPNGCFSDAPLYIPDNVNYKKFVGNKSDYIDIRKYDASTWRYFTAVNIQRTFCLVNDAYKTIADYHDIKGWFEGGAIIVKAIHEKQCSKFIVPKNATVALSPFPLFLLHYFGEPFFNECKCHEITKGCSFSCYQ